MEINLFNADSAMEETEIESVIAEFDNVRIEKIVSFGQTSDSWYCQDENEWVCVLEGNAELIYESGEVLKLAKGEHVFIPKEVKHKVCYTSKPCVWLCVFGK